ncbi:MAG TPA: MBL fold metallo-hydrolase, partial [Streptosporangiaceae bacterium]
MLLDCGATSLTALRSLGLDPGEIAAVFVSHLHGDHFGGLPFLILDGQFTRRTRPLAVAGPPGIARRLTDAMECLFPGSSAASRRFDIPVTELSPGPGPGAGPGPGPGSGPEAAACAVAGVQVTSQAVDHPSGAPALALQLRLGGRVIGYTGDTAWTDTLLDVAAGADLLIAEAYRMDAGVPFHLRHADLAARRHLLTSRRIVLTHM